VGVGGGGDVGGYLIGLSTFPEKSAVLKRPRVLLGGGGGGGGEGGGGGTFIEGRKGTIGRGTCRLSMREIYGDRIGCKTGKSRGMTLLRGGGRVNIFYYSEIVDRLRSIHKSAPLRGCAVGKEKIGQEKKRKKPVRFRRDVRISTWGVELLERSPLT